MHTAQSPSQRIGFLPVALLAVMLVAGGLFYARGYQHLPSDDPANAIIGARYIFERQSTTFPNPLNTRLNQEFYSNYIATEYPLHVALAQFALLTGVDRFLTTTNIFMVTLVLTIGLALFFLYRELTGSEPAALVGVALSLLAYWFGYTFWSGHYAQMLGYLLMTVALYALVRYERRGERAWYVAGALLTLLLFPVHSLTFLVAFMTYLSYSLCRFTVLTRNSRLRYVAFTLYLVGVIGLVTVLTTLARKGVYYQLFSVENVQAADLRSTVVTGFVLALGGALVLVGAYALLRRLQLPVLLWFLVAYVLINSHLFGVPFFPYRFNEFLMLPLLAMAVVGLDQLLRLLRSPALQGIAVAVVLTLTIPFNVTQQSLIRSCYVSYCPGLHPASLLDEDFAAFRWLGAHTDPDTLTIAAKKFGIFLPAVAVRSVEFPVEYQEKKNEAHIALTDPSEERRWEAARAIGADYIIWDGVFDRYQSTYLPYQVYSEKFTDPRRFKKVYNQRGVRIYRVVP